MYVAYVNDCFRGCHCMMTHTAEQPQYMLKLSKEGAFALPLPHLNLSSGRWRWTCTWLWYMTLCSRERREGERRREKVGKDGLKMNPPPSSSSSSASMVDYCHEDGLPFVPCYRVFSWSRDSAWWCTAQQTASWCSV